MTDDLMETGRKAERIASNLLWAGSPERPAWNQELARSGARNRWNYVDGLMIAAFLELYRLNGDPQVLAFCDGFLGSFVGEDGSVASMDPGAARLDDVCGAQNFFPLYELTGKEKYRTACGVMFRFLRSCPRIREGNFWHKRIYPHQVWLDGAFMALPFYMEYETKCGKMQHYHDLYAQFMNLRARMRDPATGLYYHGYDASRAAPWANPETGCSANFWLRADGWLAMALTDTLEQMDEQIYYEYRRLQAMLKELVDALLPWQREDGMWLQVVDRPDDPGNYPETSGTCMVARAVLKAVRLRLLPERYFPFGAKAFYGTAGRYLGLRNGEPSLGGVCLVGGLGGPRKRDGTPAYYYGEPVVADDGKGVAPFLMAYAELLRAERAK